MRLVQSVLGEPMSSYIEAQDAVRARSRIQRTIAELLGMWNGLVDECYESYQWDISEFRNELGSRDQLDTILRAPELAEYPEHSELRDRVYSIDARFRELLLPDCEFPKGTTWWRRGVLRFAGTAYADYCGQLYGFDVRIQE